MSTQNEVNDSFNWWFMLGIVLALVGLSLSPYLIYIGSLILK